MFLWVEVLNRALAWQDRDIAAHDLAADDAWRDVEHAAAMRDASLLRTAYAGRALGRGLPSAIEPWLTTLRLQPGNPERWRGFGLPALRAARRETSLPRRAEEILSTALLELALLPDVVEAVSRCHGLRRAPAPGEPSADDRALAALAGLAGFLASGWVQCPQLVHAPRLGRYCSKACSNAAFAARKGRREPRYFATKQAQYRHRQRRATAAPVRRESAFAFVD